MTVFYFSENISEYVDGGCGLFANAISWIEEFAVHQSGQNAKIVLYNNKDVQFICRVVHAESNDFHLDTTNEKRAQCSAQMHVPRLRVLTYDNVFSLSNFNGPDATSFVI